MVITVLNFGVWLTKSAWWFVSVTENTPVLVCTLGRPGTHFPGFTKSSKHYCGVTMFTEWMRLCDAPTALGEELSWNRAGNPTCVFESSKSELDKTSKIFKIGPQTKKIQSFECLPKTCKIGNLE